MSSKVASPSCPLDFGPETVNRLQDKAVLVIGDIMLDTYLSGDADRISPEAPVPVVRIEQERHLLGGAGNVARNITALGGRATLIGTVGEDTSAAYVRELLAADGVKAALLSLSGRNTTVKTRILARGQQMLRLDKEQTLALETEERRQLLKLVERELGELDVIIVSDYSKGIVSASFMVELKELIASCSRKIAILVDPKPDHTPLYEGTFLLTPNTKETGECARMPVRNLEEILAAGKSLLQQLHVEHLLTTLGADGMALFLSSDEIWHIPTMAQNVFDVTGAGDTVIATLGLALASGLELLPASILANYAAGLVVAQVGAATASPEQLSEAIRHLPSPLLTRWN